MCVRVPNFGTINDVRIVTTSESKYVLRIYEHRDQKRIEREHSVVNWLAARGFPAVRPIRLPNGETFVTFEGKFVTLLPYVSGRQITRDTMKLCEIEAMGRFLGQLHRELAVCPVADIPSIRLILRKTNTIESIQLLLRRIDSIESRTATDQYMISRLESRISWLNNRPSTESVTTDTDDAHPLHGDYQNTNVFFEGTKVSALIDWDKIYRAPAAWEIVRTLDLMVRFTPECSQRFLNGYRRENSITLEKLDTAAELYGTMRAYDIWLPTEIYENGNDRVRQFVYPGRFTPIVDRWDRLRPQLDL